MGCRRLYTVTRHIMVYNPHKLFCVRDMRILQLIVHVYRKMCCSVIAHHAVKLHCMDIAGLYFAHACRCRNNFLCYCHSHIFTLLPS